MYSLPKNHPLPPKGRKKNQRCRNTLKKKLYSKTLKNSPLKLCLKTFISVLKTNFHPIMFKKFFDKALQRMCWDV